jgi:dihydropteroate synthase
MGIVNVTPDSFSDGGDYLEVEAAVAHGLQLVEDGAEILDIGGESTRPQAEPVSADEELRRVIPVIERLSGRVSVPVSIDTCKAAVAREALDAGATVVNDISGLTFDPRMVDTCAACDSGVICMHIQGDPQTMQLNPHYDDVVGEVRAHLAQRLDDLERRGVNRERVVIDPGIGFGKTAEHNLELLSNIAALRSLGRPVLIGHSRKGFLKKLLGRPIDERLSGTIGVAIAAASQSADMLRVHDVAAVRDALTAWKAVVRRIPS